METIKCGAAGKKHETRYGGGSVMVWSLFSASGPDVLRFINGTMEQHIHGQVCHFVSRNIILVNTFIFFTKITTLSIRITMCGHGYFINVHMS